MSEEWSVMQQLNALFFRTGTNDGRYWYLVCRHCSLRWYLPQDPRRRVSDAVARLIAHSREYV
jgi:hypothetical protein